ncbi:MAG: hypothetical protein QOC68_3835 [Solirubrobacteraceae bacterium]|nr:hypothetical protein [Solirubrobacteraceae bacterium]
MSAHEEHPSVSDEPDWIRSLRQRLDQILRSEIWPQSWRPWLARRAEDLVSLSTRMSTGHARASALRTPEEIARDILDETVQSPPDPALAGTQSQPGPERAEVMPDAAPERPVEAPAASRVLGPEVFLEEMQEAMESQSAQVERELDVLRSQEKTVFTLLLVAAGITLGLLVIGAALVFTGLIAVGVLSALVALVPGTGTLILRRLERRVGADKDRIDVVRRDNVQLLQAIQVTLLIEDPAARSEKVAELSDALRTSTFGSTAGR